ncbi:MAG TPA: glycosyltransferase [Pyrinomonadaceae bacterium]|nr:glycosyltransferase [Pyrinomonadaceae bacterium]
MRILMVTIGYPPKYVGGTEIYVFGLVEELKERGHECAITYLEPFAEPHGPEFRLVSNTHLGTDVHVVQVNTAIHKLEFVMFDAALRNKLVAQFRKLVDQIDPDVIHLHPLQLGLESYLVEELNQTGRKVVMTFHSSTTTCARGDLIYMGETVCDGQIIQKRCSKCLYHWKSVPKPLSATLSQLPLSWYRRAHNGLSSTSHLRKLRSFASIPLTIDERKKAWVRTTANSKAIVAVCDWVRDTIIRNGVSPEKVVSSRHGLRLSGKQNGNQRIGVARFGYLGRISPEKGIAVLLEALQGMPANLSFEFEFCSSSFRATARRPEEDRLVNAIQELQRTDARVRVLEGVSDDDLRNVIAKWDAIIVPSLWLESGPQVVYEAFAVHTPVIGSRLGGIAELVSDGVTGLLCAPGDVGQLRNLMLRSAEHPQVMRELRDNIPPVRTTSQVAEDMVQLYQRIASPKRALSEVNLPVEASV